MTTSFASDILPLFRPGDIDCMTPRGVQLGNPDWMCDPAPAFGFPDYGNARRVYSALSRGVMPPDGKWPQDQLDIFKQWITDGFNP
jgi:hypothetical protein